MNWKERFIFLGLGLGLALGQAPFGISFLYFLILPFLAFATQQAPDAKVGFAIGWWTGIGYFALTLSWIVEPFFVEPEVTGWMAPFALFLMAGGLALFWGAAFGATVRLFDAALFRAIALAVIWTLIEYVRANVFTGFPWGHLTYAFVDLPIIQFTAWFGIHGTGFIILLGAFLPVMFGANIWKGASFSTVLFAIMLGLGQFRQSHDVPNHPDGTVVRLLQPNAAQHLKWRRDLIDVFYNRQLGYSAAKTNPQPDVVIWPETGLQFILGRDPSKLQQIANATGPNTSIISGIVRKEGSWNRNSMIFMDGRGGISAQYDKHHLVPFGEYFPFQSLVSGIGLHGLTQMAGTFQQGDGPKIIQGQNVPNFLPMICYEAIFPQYAQSSSGRPDWLVHITNDAWFGTFSGPYQHLAQSRVRAIEQGLPLARSANTGVTAMIDPYGHILKSLPLGTQGYIDVNLPAPLSVTPYHRVGEMPWVIVAFLMLLLCVFRDKNVTRSV